MYISKSLLKGGTIDSAKDTDGIQRPHSKRETRGIYIKRVLGICLRRLLSRELGGGLGRVWDYKGYC